MKNIPNDTLISVRNEVTEVQLRSSESDKNYLEPEEERPHQEISVNLTATPNKSETTVTDFPKFFHQLDTQDELGFYQYEYLSKYIALQGSTLFNDKEGILSFFMKKFKDQKLQMTFQDWLKSTIGTYDSNYINNTNKKMEQLLAEFSKLRDIITHLDLQDENDLDTLKIIIQSLQ